MKKSRYIIGIDEVGRGPLAGPVTAAALVLPVKNLKLKTESKTPLRDSKKLTAKQREEWAKFIKQNKIPYAVASVSPKIIDKINISQAANLAAGKALKKVTSRWLSATRAKIFLDGGLKIPSHLFDSLVASGYTLTTVIKGDEKIPAISLASIMAKVHRDRIMEQMHKKYHKYCFDKHKGYGTKKHYQALKKFGSSKIHRKSFLHN